MYAWCPISTTATPAPLKSGRLRLSAPREARCDVISHSAASLDAQRDTGTGTQCDADSREKSQKVLYWIQGRRDRGEERAFPDIQHQRPTARGRGQGVGPMSIFARIRQIYDRLCGRIEGSADRMRQQREHLGEQADGTDERERRIAVERDSKLLGLITGSQ